MPRGGSVFKLERAGLVAAALAAGAYGILQAEQQAVEIDGHDFGGVHGRARLPVGEPARAEVPAALRRGADIAKQLVRRTPAGLRKFRVFAV